MVGLAIVVSLVLVALLVPLLAPYAPTVGDLGQRLLPPSANHRLGTDDQGRDILSRLIHGSRITLFVVVLVAMLAAPIGLLVGAVSGYAGGWLDAVLMRVTDIFLAFPRLILALAFVAALGPGIENAVLAIAITSWPPYARCACRDTHHPSGRLHQRRQVAGCQPFAHRAAPCDAAVCAQRDRSCHVGHGGHHPHRRWSWFSGPGCAAAAAGVGCHDRSRPRLCARPVVGGSRAGCGHLHRQPGFNLLGDGLRDALDPKAQR